MWEWEGWMLRELGLFERRGWPWGESRELSLAPRKGKRTTRELTSCGELAGRCSEVVEAIEKQLGFQGLVWPQPGARQGSLRLP